MAYAGRPSRRGERRRERRQRQQFLRRHVHNIQKGSGHNALQRPRRDGHLCCHCQQRRISTSCFLLHK